MQGKGERAARATASSAWLKAWLRPHAGVLVLSLCLMLVQSLASLAQPWLGGLVTDRLMVDQGFGLLLWLIFVLVCAQQLLGYLVAVQLQKVSGRLVATAGGEVYAHLQDLPLAWHQARRRGDVHALLLGDIYRLSGYITGTLVPLLPLLLTFVGGLAMMFRLAPLIAVAVAVSLPVLVIALKLVGRRMRPLAHASSQAWADLSALAEQNLELLPVIKTFAKSSLEADNYRARAEALYRVQMREARLQSAMSPAVYVAGAGLVLLMLGLAGHLVIRDEMRVGELVSLFLYGMLLVSPITQLAHVYGTTQASLGSMHRLRDALLAPVEVDSGTLDRFPEGVDIVFAGVDFAYPGRDPLFRGFDLHIRAGETVALTGINGAGKSTLVHVLLRLVEPQAGRVSIGGIDLRQFRLDALRGQIGLVAQQVMLFNATVTDNIAYGRSGATRIQIEQAARASRAHDFIMGLPEGYDTIVGDQGIRLSGGQKQRLALARALLKDPPILILDEATAMFDPEGEAEFIRECADVLQQRTVIMITHRPASLALADRVLRMDAGSIHEVTPSVQTVSAMPGNL
ncbi:ABC transporter ATP-binding protein [Thermomonas carbonis]|uniref:ABC transporter ATP-binding protein n=1 Tax=Thermomonas carbonis TaxID=1463158 RepID=A0A7G9SN64_9GAMM|nr:ABC transporter ATP-binding protein [Thermomonas carbonis]QNN69289.1 ABC transporter ATP-binding protein [Thermomonas carbonis]GHC05461.1 ABC transporter ATP-binding protein [Thermomonas carbonis]